MKKFLKNFFNDPNVISIIYAIVLMLVAILLSYGLHVIYKL